MKSEVSGSGMGLCSVLFVVFLVLKLTNNIDWSWWWVTSPLWIPLALSLGVITICLIILGIGALFGISLLNKK